MNTVYGICMTAVGLAAKHELVQGRDRPELRYAAWSNPSGELRSVQPSSIPVDRDHDGLAVGEVVHLERDAAGNVWCVAHVRDGVAPVVHVRVGVELRALRTDLYWSVQTSATLDDRDIELRSVALTTTTARLSATPVTFLPGGLDYPDCASHKWGLDGYPLELLTRATESYRARRRAGGPILVVDPTDDATGLDVRRDPRAWKLLEDQHYDRVSRLRPTEIFHRPGVILGVR